MKLRKYLNENVEPTKEMFDFFEKRTKEHIDRVKNNIKKIVSKRSDLKELNGRLNIHDKSKYSKEEYIPYVWLSWWHNEKNNGRIFKYPKGIKELIKKATKHHITTNSHHPEFYNKPSDMNNIDIAEMIADWAAMSQELDNSLKKWADDNVGSKWKFTEEQTKLIYDLVELLK
jgi:hypothetical protein